MSNIQDSSSELEAFVDDLIAPYSVHRKRYTRPHGTVARRELKNRMMKRLKPLIDPSKPSYFSTDFSEGGVIRAILLNMEWCHAVKTESLEKATKEILALIAQDRERAIQEYKDKHEK